MPPNEYCPHCGELILDWHNEWYNAVERMTIYRGQAAMDCPLCRQPVVWFESREIAAASMDGDLDVHQRSVLLAAQWVPIREPSCQNLAGYVASHPAGQQYRGYWQDDDLQQADQQVARS